MRRLLFRPWIIFIFGGYISVGVAMVIMVRTSDIVASTIVGILTLIVFLVIGSYIAIRAQQQQSDVILRELINLVRVQRHNLSESINIDTLGHNLRDVLSNSPLLRNPLLRTVAESRITELGEALLGLEKGTLYIQSVNAMKVISQMMAAARSSVVATTYIITANWWRDPNVKDYYQQNLYALEREVSVKRIFMFKDKQEAEQAAEVLLEQQKAGIDVRVIYLSEIPPEDQIDFVIFDDKAAFVLRIAPDRSVVIGFSIYDSNTPMFKELQARARKLLDWGIPYNQPL